MEKIPVQALHLFPLLEKKLIELLHSLTPEEWNRGTIARLWTVKDVAAHLLDGNIRLVSMLRDGYFDDPPGNIYTYEDLVGYLNGLNAGWVKAMKRVSPALLIALLEQTGGKLYYQQLQNLDSFADAIFPVSWAGETNSANWFHIAREYTERWHHQQQIREAVDKPGIQTKELYQPVLDTFMLALPHTYRHTEAAADTVVQITLRGEAGGDWFLVKKEKWELSAINSRPVAACVGIPAAVAWKLFTKSWRKKEVADFITMEGDERLANVFFDTVAVMA